MVCASAAGGGFGAGEGGGVGEGGLGGGDGVGGEGGGGLGGGGDAALDPGAARLNVDAVREWLGTHQAGLAKLVEVQHELLEDLAVLQQVNG